MKHIDISTSQGVLAVAREHLPHAREFHGDPRWSPLLEDTIKLFRLAAAGTDLKGLRVVLAEQAIVVQKEGEQIYAVVIVAGHAIGKSLRRMIRRAARGRFLAPVTSTGVEL